MESPARFPFPPRPDGGPPVEFGHRHRTAPLGEVVLPTGDRATMAVRYDDVRGVLSDPRFSRDLRFPGAPRLTEPPDVTVDDDSVLINMDPPEHTRLRRIVARSFSRRNARQWRALAERTATGLLDRMPAAGGTADLMADYAFPLSLEVICAVLGVPEADRGWLRAGPDTFLPSVLMPGERRRIMLKVLEAFADKLIADRPGGLIGLLAEAHENGQLRAAELTTMVSSLITVGYESTAATLGRGVFALLRHPNQYRALCADPGLLAGAVEEVLRYGFPTDGSALRVATEDVPLASGLVRKGTCVLPNVYAANHDPARFDRPERFDITRPSGPHLAFGYGIHRCLGAHLARMELEVGLAVLVDRLPGLALAVPPEQVEWTTGMLSRRVATLPVVLA
ncbi:cytochrome P450 [Kutzneria chonburiensis]|uniref:Cytochrome P450 n=1 Tax=Kutzneria chonburiensis TaxID=1483604 RepID=A0ABV6MX18_9PSEU|nr:cytochrome P450 [Kutzneria chonburiensis]